MAHPDSETRPQFSRPIRQIFLMVVSLGMAVFGAFVALPRVLPVFEANPYLNGFIVFVFVIGVLACFWQVFQLMGSVRWIERFAAGEADDGARPPRLLAPMASLLRSRGARMQLGSSSARSILDSVAQRIDEDREITRYIANLLIFLGLLGTFYGLATTVPAVVDTIRSLAPREGEQGIDIFNWLMTGLESQLGGMGVAFASSLLGLAGSLIVGLLELFAGHGQNRFYRELEEWLSTITRLGYAPTEGDEDGSPFAPAPGAMADQGPGAGAFMAHMAEQMDALQNLFTQSDVSRAMVDERLGQLAGAVERLAQRIEDEGVSTPILLRIADGQERIIAALEGRLEDDGAGPHADAESRMRLRSIDVQLLRILEEMSAGRQEAQAELRADIAALTKAVRQLGGGGRGGS